MTEIPIYDLPPSGYPFVVECLDDDTGELLGSVQVIEPGTLVVPSFPGHRVAVRIVGHQGIEVISRPEAT